MRDRNNGQRPQREGKLLKVILLILAAAVLVCAAGGCGRDTRTQDTAVTAPSATTQPETQETAETTPPPTAPADGDSENVTCQGSYTVTDGEAQAAADDVVANIGDARLTNGVLQVYYWLEVAQYLKANPDVSFGQPLDTILCDLDDTAVTYQQYFLLRALNTWHSQQALIQMGDLEGIPTEAAYEPNPKFHEDNLNQDMPALAHLYGYTNANYEPNALHQAWLNALGTLLEEQAQAGGYSDLSALAADLAGAGATDTDIISYAHQYNRAYMYFTELTYNLELTEEELQSTAGEYEGSDVYVDFRHILLVPERSAVAEDGSVIALTSDWDACKKEAQALYNRCQYRTFAEHTFAELANKYSADEGSRLNGGLYSGISKGQMTAVLDEWLFDSSRKPGEMAILRSECGYHVVYFSGSVNALQAETEKNLTAEMYEQAVRSAMERYPMNVNYSAIRLGVAAQSGSGLDTDALLYPDVAHERFPTAPLYFQQDYPHTYYGQYPIAQWGCGITTMAMLASYMTDEEWTPPELCKRYGYYCMEQGTNIIMYDDVPGEMGFFLERRSWDWKEIVQALEDGKMVICLQYQGYWTRGGHFLLLQEVTEDGLIVVRDSNVYNYGSLSGHQIDAHEASVITPRGAYYWIYQPKITRIPACVRCDNTDHAGVPAILFTEDYYCAKCVTAMERRQDFLDICEEMK